MAEKHAHICPTCDKPMTYSRKLKKWICEPCLYGAFLTDQAQREAIKRYRQSEKGKETEKRYEQSKKGKVARERYYKSAKYKEARKRYNERLKESLAIARQAMLPRAKALTREERLLPLIDDIREFIATTKRSPSPSDVAVWAEDEYQTKIPNSVAESLIKQAQRPT